MPTWLPPAASRPFPIPRTGPSCERDVRWAGLVLVETRRSIQLWAEYACNPHAHELQASRELLERDQS